MATTIRTTQPTKLQFTINGVETKLSRVLAGGDTNTKLRKNSKRGYLTTGQSMAPSKLGWFTQSQTDDSWQGLTTTDTTELGQWSIDHGIDPSLLRVVNSCAMSSLGCEGACLDHQGMGAFLDSIHIARQMRTIAWNEFREWYVQSLEWGLDYWQSKADKLGKDLACRLNVMQDIPWEKYLDLSRWSRIKFYDYSAIPNRAGANKPNYWVTLSRKENNHAQCLDALSQGVNCAIVLADKNRPFTGNRSQYQFSRAMVDAKGKRLNARATKIPRTIDGYQTIDGDESDLRFEDTRGRKRGRWIILRLKAFSRKERAQAIDSGFALEF